MSNFIRKKKFKNQHFSFILNKFHLLIKKNFIYLFFFLSYYFQTIVSYTLNFQILYILLFSFLFARKILFFFLSLTFYFIFIFYKKFYIKNFFFFFI
uniref:Transmembrane protein n=1 Tax=Cyanoptyche gloeocystis TaxID=77922 RepID=A0A3G1IWJ2_9EUKA|nr:hypothetical protein [Cyanoptyche gloeocystis]